jgi:hypothetical protein
MLFHDREKGTIKKKKTHDDSNLLRSDTHIFAHISLAKASFVSSLMMKGWEVFSSYKEVM